MKKWSILLFSIVLLLTACGQKYDKEIDEVTKLEKQSVHETKDSKDRDIKRKTSNFNVYEEGKVIVISYKYNKNHNYLWHTLYRLNETNNEYEEDKNGRAKDYMKNHEPDYKEENLKK